MTWEISVKHNYSIYPPLTWMMISILGLKHSHARCNVTLSLPTNVASIAILNDDIGMSRFGCDPFNYTSYVV